MQNSIVEQVKSYIREPFSFPGGYPKLLILADGAGLYPDCAKDNFRLVCHATRNPDYRCSWEAIGVDLFLEGAPVACGQCGTAIHAAYCDCQECEQGWAPA